MPDVVECFTWDFDISLGMGLYACHFELVKRGFHLKHPSLDEGIGVTNIFFISCSFIYVHLFIVSSEVIFAFPVKPLEDQNDSYLLSVKKVKVKLTVCLFFNVVAP